MVRLSVSRALAAGVVTLGLFATPAGAQEPADAPTDSIPGPRVPPLPAEETDLFPWVLEWPGWRGVTIERYNRVDGLVPGLGVDLAPVDPLEAPAVSGRIARATTHDRTYWSASIAQRLPAAGSLVLRWEHHHRTTTFDGWRFGSRENDLAVFLFGSDLLDWWRERGWSMGLDWESPGGTWDAAVSFLDVFHWSEPDRAPFALLADEEYRDNPAVEDGDVHGVSLSAGLDTRDVQSPMLPAEGWIARGEIEGAGGVLGGDVSFARAMLDLRRYTRLARDAWWDSRAVWMGPVGDDDLPPQRMARLGGPGSLRGFDVAEFVGDDAVQLSSEVRLPLPVTDEIAFLFLNWHWVGFVDAGAAGRLDEWHADVGTGISGINIFSYLGLFVAQRVTDLDTDDAGPRLVVRLRRDF